MPQDRKPPSIRGVVESGAGRGAYFTQVDWVRSQCRDKLGFEPFPGTLNVRVVDDDLGRLEAFLQGADVKLVPEDPAFCAARVKPVLVNGAPAALVLPSEDVRIHEQRVIEILAGCSLKERLGLVDGDLVTVAAPSARKQA